MYFKTLNLFAIVLSILLTLTITISVEALVGDPCDRRGSHGWNDKMLFMRGTESDVIEDAQSCCNSCNNEITCISWTFFPVRKKCYFAFTPDNGTDFCSSACFAVPSFLDFEGGIVKCQNSPIPCDSCVSHK